MDRGCSSHRERFGNVVELAVAIGFESERLCTSALSEDAEQADLEAVAGLKCNSQAGTSSKWWGRNETCEMESATRWMLV